MNKQVSIIVPRDQNEKEPHLFMGPLCLGSYLKQKGITVKIYDEQLGEASENIDEIISQSFLVGFSVMTSQLKSARDLSIKIHNAGIPIIWGGCHPTLFPKQCLNEEYVDFTAYDEGEETLFELATQLKENNLNFSEIKGLWFKKEGNCIKNPPREYIDLNSFSPQWDLMNINAHKHYLNVEGKKFEAYPLHVGRGCPFECAFCIQTILNKRKHRSLTAENIVKEIDKILAIRKVDLFDFEDDNFFVNLDRVKEFCRLYKEKNYNFKWVGTCRVNYVLRMEDDFLKELKSCGCVLFRMGLESGNQRVLDELIKKGIKVDDVFKVIEKVRPQGISLECSFMTGIPGETPEEQKQTFDHIKKILKVYDKVHIIGPQLYRPYPGAEMYQRAIALGFKEPKSIHEWVEFLNNFGFLDINQLSWINNKKLLLNKCKYFAWSQTNPKGLARPLGLLFREIFRLRIKTDFYGSGADIWLYENMKNIYTKNR